MVDTSAPAISVPPRLASTLSIQRLAEALAWDVPPHMPRLRCSTVLPNRDKENLSEGSKPATMLCSALRAALMLSPPIEPLQSTNIFAETDFLVRSPSCGLKLAINAVCPSAQASRQEIAEDWFFRSLTVRMKSRSNDPRCARRTTSSSPLG